MKQFRNCQICGVTSATPIFPPLAEVGSKNRQNKSHAAKNLAQKRHAYLKFSQKEPRSCEKSAISKSATLAPCATPLFLAANQPQKEPSWRQTAKSGHPGNHAALANVNKFRNFTPFKKLTQPLMAASLLTKIRQNLLTTYL